MINAVMVYADGTVGFKNCRKELAEFREPIMSRLSWVVGSVRDDCPIIQERVYTRCGRMYDGRPIFCEPPFEVKEIFVQGKITHELMQESGGHAREEILREIERFTRSEEAIVLDEQRTETPYKETDMTTITVRRKVAVKTGKGR